MGLTKKGKCVLREEDVDVVGKGKGGLEYRSWQHKIADFYRDKGYKVRIEHKIEGKSVDVFPKNEEKVGIEVAISAKGEVENIKKDLKLDLGQLIMACKNERVMSDIGMKAKDTIGREKVKGVKFQVVAYAF